MFFDDAFEILIGHEGGYSDDPQDPGNWTGGKVGAGILKGTKYGISAAQFPDYRIADLTLAEAKGIYILHYWSKFDFKKNLIPDCLRFDLFDTAVNSGVDTAIKLLQKSAGVKDDGDIGPITRTAIVKMDDATLEKRFHGHRLAYLTDLKNFPRFGKGWIRRCATNMLID